MFCNGCGKEVTDDAHFCRYCGAQLSLVVNDSSGVDVPVQTSESTEKRSKSKVNRRYWLAGAVLGIAVIVGASISLLASNEVHQPSYSAGDQWVYKTIVIGKERRQVVTVTSVANGAVEVEDQLEDLGYGGTSTYRIDNGATNPNKRWRVLDFPLKPGKTWVRMLPGVDGYTSGSSYTFTVGQWSDVSVPAGTFRALAIFVEHKLPSSGMDALIIRGTEWYSPSVKNYIKSEDGDGITKRELVSFSLK